MLTEHEKSRIRYHLGFPNVGYTTVLALGFPAGGHPAFLLEGAMDALLPAAEPNCRDVIIQCDCIEQQMKTARSRMKVATVGDVVLRSDQEILNLEEQYRYWTDALVDIFGVNKNPFSKKHQYLQGDFYIVGGGGY